MQKWNVMDLGLYRFLQLLRRVEQNARDQTRILAPHLHCGEPYALPPSLVKNGQLNTSQ